MTDKGPSYDAGTLPPPVTVTDTYLKAVLVEQRLARKAMLEQIKAVEQLTKAVEQLTKATERNTQAEVKVTRAIGKK